MLISRPGSDPFFLMKLFLEKPLHTYNPMLFAGVLFARPFAMGLVMMMPFLPVIDMRTPTVKSTV